MLNKLNKACDDILESLAKIVPNNGAEVLLNQQTQLLSQQVQMAKERQDLIEEMLTESREQTGTFKRFETDLAVSLAAAINQSVSPQMELMTSKLVGAIEGLSEKMGTMNQEALKTMLNDFAAMLKKATESEMKQLQQTLKELADRLQSVGGILGEGGTKAGDAINEASALLVSRVQEISENLSTGATDMQTAASAINTAMGELERAVTDAANIGQRGAVFVNDTLAKVNTTLERLDSVSGGLAETSQAMGSVSEKIANVVDNVEELSKEQRAVVLAVKEVAPTALAAVERVTGVLDQAASQTLSVMEQTKQSMESTAVTLNKTVVSITEGLTVYSNQVAELHQQMDGQLTKSVGSFETAASAINTAMGELEKTVADASNIGQRGAVFVNDTLEKLGATLERLDSVSGGLAEMSQAMESVGGKIANVVDNVEELSKEQRAVVLAVKEVAPTALAAVERVTGVLDQAASQTLNVMEQTKQSMESTAVTLTKTVASITEGVTVYSNQVAELHRQMDGQLAKAVGSFDRGVNELAESVEELADINDKVNQSLSDVDGNVVLLTQSVKNLTARIK
jgi:methyl-accepting chemotaxis protein